MKLIEVPCYNCNSSEYELYDTENGYNLVKCSSCGLLYVNPRPAEEDISKAKLTGVHEGETTIATTGRYMHRKVARFNRILRKVYPGDELAQKESTWFDIGCGYGELIQSLNKISKGKVKAKGSELNEIKVAGAKKRNLDVDFYDIDNMGEQFDYLSLFNVWSHLPNPVEFLENLKKLLRPGGELLLETGHTSHLKKEHQHYPHYLPDHLSFANQDIVENVLKNIGFEIVETHLFRSPIYPVLYNPLDVGIELAKIVLNKYGSFKNFFPKHPNRDMFVRARLKE